MIESLPPAAPVAPRTEPFGARRVPVWMAALLTLGSAGVAAWATQAWLLRDSSQTQAVHGLLADEQAWIELAPTAAGTPPKHVPEHAPTMLYGMLPLHSGHGLRD